MTGGYTKILIVETPITGVTATVDRFVNEYLTSIKIAIAYVATKSIKWQPIWPLQQNLLTRQCLLSLL